METEQQNWSLGEWLRISLSTRTRSQLSNPPWGQLGRISAPLRGQIRTPLEGLLSGQLREDWTDDE